MRKINYYLFFFVLLLIMALPVSAADTFVNKHTLKFKSGSTQTASGIEFTYDNFDGNPVDTSNSDNAYKLYYAFDQNGTRFEAFCRHPGKSMGTYGNLTQKEIFNPDDSVKKRAYAVGVNAILLSYKEFVDSPYLYFANELFGVHGQSLRNVQEVQIATNIALRAYEMMWSEFSTNRPSSSYKAAKLAPFATMANEIMQKDRNLQNLISTATGMGAPLIYYDHKVLSTDYYLTTSGGGASVANIILAYADTLVKKGFQAAIAYKQNPLTPKITVSRKSSTQAVIKNAQGNITGYKFTENYEIKVKDLKSNAAFYLDSLTYPSGVTASVSMDGRPISSGAGVVNPNSDLLAGNSAIRNGEGTIALKIEFTTTSCTSNKSFSYTLKYKYKSSHYNYSSQNDIEHGTTIFDLQTYDAYRSGDKQHYYILTEINPLRTGSVTKTLTNNNCNEQERHTCEKVGSKYYCANNSECSQSEFENQCGCRTDAATNTYYCSNGLSCSEADYRNTCEPTCDNLKNQCEEGNDASCTRWDTECKPSCDFYETNCFSSGDINSDACREWSNNYQLEYQRGYCEKKECADYEAICDKVENVNSPACRAWKSTWNDEFERGYCEIKNCEYYEELCDLQGDGSSACTLWERNYPDAFQARSCNPDDVTPTDPDRCDAYVSNTKCDASPSKLVIQEGYAGGPYCSEPSSSSRNVKKCILENKDINDNSYQSTLVSSSNKYCQVYCTEDYEFTMPGDIYVNKLRALDVTVSAKGTKTCYSTMVKDADFKDNVNDLIDKIVRYYNQYMYYKATKNRLNPTRAADAELSPDPHSCQGPVCTSNCDYNGDGICDYNCQNVWSSCYKNCDTNNDGICDYNCNNKYGSDLDDGSFGGDAGDDTCDYNCDDGSFGGEADDGICDRNCDDGNRYSKGGIAHDGVCDYNCDDGSFGGIANDGKCDRNCDDGSYNRTKQDGRCDRNCDNDRNGVCDYNCENSSGSCIKNCDDGSAYGSRAGDGVCDKYCVSSGTSSCVCSRDDDRDGVGESNCSQSYGRRTGKGGETYIYQWSFTLFDINNTFNLSRFTSSLGSAYTNVTCSKSGTTITCTYKSEGTPAWCPPQYGHTADQHDAGCTDGLPGTDISEYITTAGLNAATTNLQNAIKQLNDEIGAYAACSSWDADMKYTFAPEIEFDYEVDLTGDNNKFSHKTILDAIAGSRVDGDVDVKKCDKETDDTYTLCNGSEDGWVDDSALSSEEITIPDCTLSGGVYTCTLKRVSLKKLKSMKASITSSENYNLDTRYSNVYYTGSILFNLDKIDIQNGRLLESLYPVGSKLEASYDYSINVKNIGEYYDNPGKLGRIWGDTQSVYKTAVSQTNTCRTATKESSVIDGVIHEDGVYACTVQVTNGKTCEKVAGWYFCKDGKVCLQSDFERECGCAELGENRYRLPNGRETTDEEEYKKACVNPTGNKCTIVAGQHYCTNGNACTEDEYKNMCGCRIEGGTYYCSNGVNCSEDQYIKECYSSGDDPKPDPNPDCPECPVYCPPGKTCESCPEGDCPVTCPLCLFNENLNVHTRPVTPDNINPNDRDLGDNWESGIDPSNPDANVYVTTSLQLKAYATTKEIQQDSNLIYEVDFDSQNNNVGNDFAMEVTLDSALIAYIKNYNANAGTYADNSLKCYDYKDPSGNTHENIYCYSTFIDDLVKNQSSKIKVKGNRLLDENQRKTNTQTSGYWTTFDKADQSKWHVITTTHTLEYLTTKFGYDSVRKIDYGIGPSWK